MNSVADVQRLLDEARATLTVDLTLSGELCQQAILLAHRQGNLSAEAEARHMHAQTLYKLGKSIDAIEEVKQAIELRQQTGEKAKVSQSLNSLGIFLTEIGDYSTALESHFSSLRIKEELEDKTGIASALINIGSVYHRLHNTEQETEMYERSLSIANEIGDAKLVAYNHLNLGLLFSTNGKTAEALQYLEKLDETFLSFGDKWNALRALNNQGLIFFKSGENEKALERYKLCYRLSKETGNIHSIVSSLVNIAEVKLKLGDADAAKKCIDELLPLAQKNDLKIYQQEAQQILSDYYISKSDYKNSLDEFKKYVAIKDELINSQNLKQLGEMQLRYDLTRKEKEAEIHQLKNVELKETLGKLQEEKDRSEKLLLNILPEEVAEELKTTGTAKAKYFEQVTVMFIDIKNFTTISEQLSPEELVGEIDFLFRSFDKIVNRHGVEKIKTIGDAYMCAGGIPVSDIHNAENVLKAAIEISGFMRALIAKRKRERKLFFEIRIGVSSGPVVAGIVGSSKFAYDIWGDTVNTAARMEQASEVGRINVSGTTYGLLKNKFEFEHRGKINAKNKGEVDMYFLSETTQ